MADGHFHLHTAAVSRGKGHSAVAAAAYQAGQDLEHEQQRCFAIGLEHRKELGKGVISEELRQAFREVRLFELETEEPLAVGAVGGALREAFERAGKPLSERCRIYQGEEGFTLRDRDGRASYRLRELEDGTVAVSRTFNRGLSKKATAEKVGRLEWRITDGEKCYTVREYREKVKDADTGKWKTVPRHLDIYADRHHRYSHKRGVLDSWVQVGDHAPDWLQEMATQTRPDRAQRERLWNWAEGLEKARDGRAARAFNAALPRELSLSENMHLVQKFCDEQFTKHGLVVDVAIHDAVASDGLQNLHCHLLVTTRQIGRSGEPAKKKSPYWDSKQRVHDWREAWAETVNKALEDAGSDTRVDHRSNADRGIADAPGEHLGPEQWEQEKRGIETERGDRNRERDAENLLGALARETLDGWPEETPALSERLDPHLLVQIGENEMQRADAPTGADGALQGMARQDHSEEDEAVAAINRALQDHRAFASRRLEPGGMVKTARTTVQFVTRLKDYARVAAKSVAEKLGLATFRQEADREPPSHVR